MSSCNPISTPMEPGTVLDENVELTGEEYKN